MDFDEYKKHYLKERYPHAKQVEKLSLRFFEELQTILPEKSAEFVHLLKYGALLHDVGMEIDEKNHNKLGARLILENGISGLNEEETALVAAIVRYHRGSMPKSTHRRFSALSKDKQRIVRAFSSIIRLADALDYKHENLVLDIDLKIDFSILLLTLKTDSNIMLRSGFLKFFRKKKELFEKTFKLTVQIKA